VGSLLAIIIVALVLRFNQVPIGSASEPLRNASEAQAAKLRAIAEGVIHSTVVICLKWA